MASQIIAIKNTIQDLLRSNSDVIGIPFDRIYTNRVSKIDNQLMPAIGIYVRSDKRDRLSVDAHWREYFRMCPVSIDVYLFANDFVDNTAFEYQDLIERVLLRESENDNWADIQYLNSELNLDNSGDHEYGILTINLEVYYYKPVDYEDLPDFTGMNLDYQIDVTVVNEPGSQIIEQEINF